MRDLDVGGGEAYLAAYLLTAYYAPRETVRPTEALAGGSDVALGKQLAHERGTVAHCTLGEGLGSHHLDAQLTAVCLVVGKALALGLVFCGAMAEVVVVARKQQSYIELVAQYLIHELAGSEARHGCIERQHDQAVDSRLA